MSWAPKTPLKPVYPPGSSGRRSSCDGAVAQTAESWAQWMAKPTKSVWARARAAVPDGAAADAFASVACGDGLPNTLVMSPLALVLVFSRTVLAVATAPKSQPARVYGTHGAGAFFPSGVTMFGTLSAAGTTGSVQ